SAKFIDACRNAGIRPAATHDLSSLRTITSTGSTLVAEGFDWVYGNVKADVHLASISGGTDLCGCLVAGDPTAPVRRGEIQRPGLAMDMDVVDDSGETLPPGIEGELVCRRPFPSMPLRFWDDPDEARYRAAYFERIDGVWHHGDFASRTPSGGFVISGRSDATLNPGGVRIGTAEIYRRVDTMPEVGESIAVGQPYGADTRIVLFVRMSSGHELTDELRDAIRRRIRAELSPRHVPAVIAAVDDIPRTRSGKMTETAVRDVICGRPVRNTSAMTNPEALDHFRDRPELA
ncbi:MAG: AMP-binding protein, partial [Acidimicrobiaceae bacterium]|nr:AMP-binding protein [Acidimicrobiaceae bacterium]